MESAQQQALQRQQLAKYTREELESETVLTLREMAKGLFPVSRLTKKKLIESILIATEAERVLLAIATEQSPDSEEAIAGIANAARENISEDLGEWLQCFYDDFRRVTIADSEAGRLTPKIYADISSLADRATQFICRTKSSGEDRVASTIARERSRVSTKLREMIEAERASLHHPVLTAAYSELQKQLSIRFADISLDKKLAQKPRLNERKEYRDSNPNIAAIDFAPILELARETLENVDRLAPRDWKQVVFAIAATTGRRPAEIQTAGTQFDIPTPDTLAEFERRLPMLKINAPIERLIFFTGQLKEKGLAGEFYAIAPYYAIPTLINANAIANAHQWLIQNEKIADTPEQANRRYSNDLSQYLRGLRHGLNIQNEMLTLKGLRACYAQISNHLFNSSNPDSVLFFAKILGHGRADLVALNASGKGYEIRNSARITDLVTPQSYNSDFVVKNWEAAKP